MAITSVRLVDGAQEMQLAPRDGVRVRAIEVSSPDIRAVTEERADDDGERDTTELHGARAVTVDLLAIANPSSLQEEITRFLHPRSRPYLHITDDEWADERRIRLRAEQWAGPLSADLPPSVREIQASWRAPDGVWEDVTERLEVANADAPATAGITYPLSYPIVFASTEASGEVLVGNPGTTDVHFTARLYGPCNGPRLTLGNTGEVISFTEDLSLSAGDYVEVDTRRRTAFLLSDPALSRLSSVDFADHSWWRLLRGRNQIRFNPISGVGPGSVAEIRWRPQYL